jgi:hypothetical protein
MTVMARTCQMQMRRFLMPTTQSESYEKRAATKDDLSLAMTVEDQARQTVLSLPFFPGC